MLKHICQGRICKINELIFRTSRVQGMTSRKTHFRDTFCFVMSLKVASVNQYLFLIVEYLAFNIPQFAHPKYE